MGGKTLTLKAWMLPLIVLALVVPGTAGFIVAGPGLGLAIGALSAAAVIAFAISRRPDEPIEVAGSTDRQRRLLLVALEPVDQPQAIEGVRGMTAAGGGPDESDEKPDVLVLAPALNTPLATWASDVGRSRLDAQRTLVLTIGALAAANVEARGKVGDPDPLQAVEDTLRDFAADEVIVALGEGEGSAETRRLADELRRRLDLPVDLLSARPPVRS
jgi:hypothetical protein